MLPILRIIPVGGVFLAIMIVVLSLSPPGGSRPGMPTSLLSARGPLMQKDEHPEWRQLLILAAIRRADELGRLRDLPDTPIHSDSAQDANKQDSETDAGKVAGLPIERNDADPDDETGSINEMPGATIPIDIGETSSTELPMKTPEETPPVIRTPERVKKPHESRRKVGHRVRRAAAAKPQAIAQFNIFEFIFGGLQAKPQPAGIAPPRQPAAAPPYSQNN